MKHLAKMMALTLAVGLWSCSSDEPGASTTPETQGDVYTSLTLSLPTSSRAETVEPGDNPAESNNGFEIGQDYENNVNQIYVVLAEKNTDGTYGYITKSLSNAVLNQSVSKPTYTVQFKSDELRDFAKGEQNEVHVFAYCNPTTALIETLNALTTKGASFADEVGEIADGTNLDIATPKSFLMTNALPTVATLPTYEVLVRQHNTQATAFNLGTVIVERVSSRFDFMSKYNAEGEIDNSYMIKDNVSDLNVAKIELQGLSLFNLAKQYYYLPRVSATGTETNAELLGRELPTNWVVSPNVAAKEAFAQGGAYSAVSGNYFFNLTDAPADYTYTAISSLGSDDNDGWIDARGTNYKIWRYATENTLPGVAAQKYGITTGIYFKGEIKSLDDAEITGHDPETQHPAAILKAAMAAGETLYAFSESEQGKVSQVAIMLGSAMDVWEYCYTHNTSVIRSQFLAAVAKGYFSVKHDGVAKVTEAEVFPVMNSEEYAAYIEKLTVTGQTSNTVADFVAEGNFNFIAYVPTKEGNENHYYVFYPYFNRHNDNGDPATMGVMEFATVRNNVYKIRVNTVMQFGLPGDVPPPPPTDDETPEVYFKVSVQVLDWVVRENVVDL